MNNSMKVLSFKDTRAWLEADPWMAPRPPLTANHTSNTQQKGQPYV